MFHLTQSSAFDTNNPYWGVTNVSKTIEIEFTKTLPIAKQEYDEGILRIWGYASTNDVDHMGDIITLEALSNGINEYLKFPTIRYMHRPEPIGRVVAASVDDKGLFIEGIIVDEKVQRLIQTGVLNALSIGGWIKDYTYENGKRVIRDLRIVEISVVDVPANPNAVITEFKGIVPSHNTSYGKVEDSWDADAAEKRIRRWASRDGSGEKEFINWSRYAEAFAWYDDKDPENFGSYKLPHHDIRDGKFVVVWRGVVAAMAALLGARGGVRIPEEDRRRVYNHLAKHYREFDKEPPEYKSLVEALIDRVDLLEEVLKTLSIVVNEINTPLRVTKDLDVAKEIHEIEETNEEEEVAEILPLKEDEEFKQRIIEEMVIDTEEDDGEEPIRRHSGEPEPQTIAPRVRGFFDLLKVKYGGENK